MKKILLAGTALAVFGAYSPALAQYDKDNDNAQIMSGAQQSQTQEEPAQTTTTTTTAAPQVEPQAGTTYEQKQPYDFSGPYVGADIGYSIGSYKVSDPAGPDGNVGLDGTEGGVFAGYGMTHQFSWLSSYTGIEVGYEWSGADGRLAGTQYEQNHKWLATFRPGISMNDDALGYGIIGYSRAQLKGNGDDSGVNGLVLGAGTEFNTKSPMKVRLEYTYTNYGDTNLSNVNLDGHENDVKAGLVFRL